MKAIAAAAFSLSSLLSFPHQAFAWGDEGHMTVALIAEHYLQSGVKTQIMAMLAADTDNLTKHDLASEATWADKYRDADERRSHYEQTENWHFVDLEIDNPDLNKACFGRSSLSPGTVASDGPSKACAVDKINQFVAELKAPSTDPEERIMALKFVLHFVGDIHQPLHSSDHEDRGGNEIKVIADGIAHHSRDELHGYWDTQFVEGVGSSAPALATKLIEDITLADVTNWSSGMPQDWAMEAFKVSQRDTYGRPPLSKGGKNPHHLDAAYVAQAEKDVAMQLSRAGVRLAYVLNEALGGSSPGRRAP
jgi:S1/P1 Nuclease